MVLHGSNDSPPQPPTVEHSHRGEHEHNEKNCTHQSANADPHGLCARGPCTVAERGNEGRAFIHSKPSRKSTHISLTPIQREMGALECREQTHKHTHIHTHTRLLLAIAMHAPLQPQLLCNHRRQQGNPSCQGMRCHRLSVPSSPSIYERWPSHTHPILILIAQQPPSHPASQIGSMAYQPSEQAPRVCVCVCVSFQNKDGHAQGCSQRDRSSNSVVPHHRRLPKKCGLVSKSRTVQSLQVPTQSRSGGGAGASAGQLEVKLAFLFHSAKSQRSVCATRE
eukprot:COSAG06_NODE_2704_length_6419_cov_1.259019_3_plen_280_part_00